MIKILHTGDIHLGDLAGPTKDGKNLRRLDTLECMDAIVYRAKKEGPHLTIIAGDLFNRSRVWADTALEDVNDALERFIRPLCEYSEKVVLLFGTENHDNPRAFEVLKKSTADLRNLRIYTTPQVDEINTSEGKIQVVAVPGFDKGRIRLFCPGADKETENRNATALINDVVLGLATQIDKSKPAVLVAHYTVSGAEADNGSTFLAGQDVVILPSTIDAAGVDLACFGHIHKHQRLVSNTPAYYCGSPNQLTFNDEGMEHGFYIHTIFDTPAAGIGSEFVRTPERKHLTLRLCGADVSDFIANGNALFPTTVREAIVRVRYSCNAEQDKAFNRAELQKQLMAAGAFYVAEITPEDIEALDAQDQLTEHDGPAECLERWLDANDITGAKAARLLELAMPIIKQADDGRDDGKHTGAFIPKTIEVKNYRSYTAAEFDFEPVHMAMVNGQNGVGKSSLFMDAIADCLFEQSRKEDVGGWVRDGTKSGSITFCFGMGGQEYRVIRTRTKSGRGTLSLQRLDPEKGAWADDGDTTMKLTQAKIERLLGMDCNTFCSIALIRQDAYGIFLDADSDRRMEVLSALLGLDIYGRMEEISKSAATEQRRKIAAAKERINILSEKLTTKDELSREDEILRRKIEEAEETIRDAETELEILKGAEALRLEILRQADEKEAQVKEYTRELHQKTAELEEAERQYKDTLYKTAGLEAAERAAEAVKEARATLQRTAPIIEHDKELLKERARVDESGQLARRRVLLLREDHRKYEAILSRKAEIEEARTALVDLSAKQAEVKARIEKKTTAAKWLTDAQSATKEFVADSRGVINGLEARLKAAQDEAAKLENSGCALGTGATCNFLLAAVAAANDIPMLEETLKSVKVQHRAEYEDLKATENSLRTEYEALGDPYNELKALDAQEAKLRALADMAPDLATAEAKIEEIETAIAEARKISDEAESRLAEIDAERVGLEPAVRENRMAEQNLAMNEGQAEELPACMAAAAKAEALKQQVTSIRDEHAAIAQKIARIATEAEDIKKRVPEKDTTTEALRSIVSTYREKVNECAVRRGAVAAKLETVAEAEAQISDLRREVEDIAATLNDYTTLAHAFGIDGIRYMIIRGVVQEITRRSNDILAVMTGGRMVVDIRTEREQKSTKQIVNSLEVCVSDSKGFVRPYDKNSGGEKVRIALAVTLALADIKNRRAGVQLGMLFIDEPPFLDAYGADAYADALVRMANRNPNMCIIAISHDPTMKARFSQNIIVTAGEDGSTVTME